MSLSPVNNSAYINSLVQDIRSGKNLDYSKVKADYLKNNPNGDFVRDIGKEILKITLGEQKDSDINKKAIEQLQRLATADMSPNQVSFPVAKKGNFGDPPAYETTKQTQGTLSGEFQLNINDSKSQNVDNFVAGKVTSLPDKPITGLKYNKDDKSYTVTLNSNTSLYPDVDIKIKTDPQKGLYYETSGFFANVPTIPDTIKNGLREGLKNSGIDATFEEKDGKVFITPNKVTVKGVDIDAKNLKFEFNDQGIKVKADKADFKGNASVLSDTGLISKDSLPSDSTADVNLKGNVKFSENETKLNIDSASADLKIKNNGTDSDVKNFIKSIKAQAKTAVSLTNEITSNLEKSGIPKEVVNTLLGADDKKIGELLQDPSLVEKLKQSSLYLKVDVKNVSVTSDNKGINVDGKNTSVLASSGLEKKEDLNFDKLQKLKTDLPINQKVLEELNRKGLDKNILDSINNSNDLDKIPQDKKDKLKDIVGAIYNREELASASFKANTLSGSIGEKTFVDAIGTVSQASVSNGVGKISLSAKADTLGIDKDVKDGKLATVKGASVGIKADNIKLTKEDLENLSKKVNEITTKIETEVKKIGLTKEQFLGIANAITNISDSKESAKKQISKIAKEFNATDKQINDFMNLFSSKEFNGLLSNSKDILKQITEAKNGSFNFSSEVKSDSLEILNKPTGLITTANNLSAKINASTSDNKVKATATLGSVSTTISNNSVISSGIKTNINANAGDKTKVSFDSTISSFNMLPKESSTSMTLGNISGKFTDGAFVAGADIGKFTFDQNIGLSSEKSKLTLDYTKRNHAEIKAGNIFATNDGLGVKNITLDAKASRKEKTASGNININGNISGIATKIEGKDKTPTATINGANLNVSGNLNTAIGSIEDVNLNLSSKEMKINPSGDVKGDPKISNANGEIKMTYSQLKKFIENNSSGKAILKGIKDSGIDIPNDQNLTLKLDKGSIKSGNFSGSISLPNFDTGLGKASVSIKVDTANISTQKVNLGGAINLKMDADKVFKAMRTSLSLDDSIKLSVDEQNKIKAKIDGFFKSGEASISVENNEVKIHIDKAQFMKLFSVKGMAREQFEDLLKKSNIEFNTDKNNINIPIKELTNYIGANDLTISGVTSDANGNYQIPFKYKN